MDNSLKNSSAENGSKASADWVAIKNRKVSKATEDATLFITVTEQVNVTAVSFIFAIVQFCAFS